MSSPVTASRSEISVAFSPDYLTVYATSIAGGPIAKFNTSGYLLGFVGAGSVIFPMNLCTDSAGNLYVTDIAQDAVVKLAPNGTKLATFRDPSMPFNWDGAQGLTIEPTTGNVVVADYYNARLVIFFPNGTVYKQVLTSFNGASLHSLRRSSSHPDGTTHLHRLHLCDGHRPAGQLPAPLQRLLPLGAVWAGAGAGRPSVRVGPRQ